MPQDLNELLQQIKCDQFLPEANHIYCQKDTDCCRGGEKKAAKKLSLEVIQIIEEMHGRIIHGEKKSSLEGNNK